MRQERERSRAYPVIDLETAYEILSKDLRSLGSESLDREALAKRLGYETGGGGVAARKIGALVQYGFLNRHAGKYSLNLKGSGLQKIRREAQKFRLAIESALEHPALFRWILDRYRRVGKIPENLAVILAREYGITERASYEAANVFLRSARFAGILDAEGCFLDNRESPAGEEEEALPKPEFRIEPWEITLTNRRKAYLTFPEVMTDDDVEMLEEGLQFAIEKGRLRKYLRITPKSAEGNVVPVGFGKRSGKKI
jgi:hypothetical protein